MDAAFEAAYRRQCDMTDDHLVTILFDCECTPFTPPDAVEACLASATASRSRADITEDTCASLDRCIARMKEYLGRQQD